MISIMCDDIDVHLGQRLRRRRLLLGLTQRQLSDVCGLRFQQIQKYECGANRLSASRLWQLAEALDAPVEYFYDGLASRNEPVDLQRERIHRAMSGLPSDGAQGRTLTA